MDMSVSGHLEVTTSTDASSGLGAGVVALLVFVAFGAIFLAYNEGK